MMRKRRLGRIGVYGAKTRAMQRRITYEAFGLSCKVANVYRYLGSRMNDEPSINDVQNVVFFETPDRAYDSEYVTIPIGMDALPEDKIDYGRFGLVNMFGNETRFRVHVDDFEPLGREMIIGDAFHLPFYDKNGEKSMWEVVDVDLNSEAEKFIAILHCTPMAEHRGTTELPIDRSSDEFMSEILADMDDYNAMVTPSKDVIFDGVIPLPEPVDFRDELHSSFLDDPDKEF